MFFCIEKHQFYCQHTCSFGCDNCGEKRNQIDKLQMANISHLLDFSLRTEIFMISELCLKINTGEKSPLINTECSLENLSEYFRIAIISGPTYIHIRLACATAHRMCYVNTKIAHFLVTSDSYSRNHINANFANFYSFRSFGNNLQFTNCLHFPLLIQR